MKYLLLVYAPGFNCGVILAVSVSACQAESYLCAHLSLCHEHELWIGCVKWLIEVNG